MNGLTQVRKPRMKNIVRNFWIPVEVSWGMPGAQDTKYYWEWLKTSWGRPGYNMYFTNECRKVKEDLTPSWGRLVWLRYDTFLMKFNGQLRYNLRKARIPKIVRNVWSKLRKVRVQYIYLEMVEWKSIKIYTEEVQDTIIFSWIFEEG